MVTRFLFIIKALSRHQWEELFHAILWVPLVRTALLLLPWRSVSAALDGKAVTTLESPDWASAKATVWAVGAVSRRLLRDRPCLTQALVAQRRLRKHGVETRLKLGATQTEGVFRAHAWLEQDGHVILGGSDSAKLYNLFRPI